MDPMITILVYLGDALVRAPRQYALLIDEAFKDPKMRDPVLASRLKTIFEQEFGNTASPTDRRAKLRSIASRLKDSPDERQRFVASALESSLGSPR